MSFLEKGAIVTTINLDTMNRLVVIIIISDLPGLNHETVGIIMLGSNII